MNLKDTFFHILPPLHKEGFRFVGPLLVVTIIFLLLWPPLGFLCFFLLVWCYYFFRNPTRYIPSKEAYPNCPRLIVAPADGVVLRVCKGGASVPMELNFPEADYTCVSIFMSIFNCHVNRSPIEGRVKRIVYKSGKFVNASLNKASEDNERNCLVIEYKCASDGEKEEFSGSYSREIGVVQIAGLVARRIVCSSKEGEYLLLGEPYGIIRFGSRVDLYIPTANVRVVISKGQTVIGGETVIGFL